MNKQTEALKLALEVLECDPLDMALNPDGHMGFRKDQAITAIREALAEQPAQPLPGRNHWEDGDVFERIGAMKKQPAQQQKEGFASPGGGYVPAIPRPMPPDWKLVPRKATPEMLKAMDECAQEGYDERLYAGMASSVYMAAWDASPVMGTLPEQPAQQQACDSKTGESEMQSDLKFAGETQAQQQEPVAWLIWLHGPAGHFDHKQFAELEFERRNKEYPDPDRKLLPLYTSPPASNPLTDEEIILIVAECASSHQHTDIHFARAIEAKLREKNA